jgi:hypothetical protein
MVRLKLRFLSLLLIVFVLFTGCVANSQQAISITTKVAEVKSPPSKQALARAVLAEAGMANQYDLYLGNSLDLAVPSETAKNAKFMAWMQNLLVQEAGWNYVESQYIGQLEANFSEQELKDLLNFAKQPLLQKLLQAEMQAYTDTAEERRKLLSKLWDDYNSGRFNPPPEVLQ